LGVIQPGSPEPAGFVLLSDERHEHLAAAMTILLTDYGGTTPSDTCEMIADDARPYTAPMALGAYLAVCEEIQFSEIPEQSRLYQRMFQRFNIRYFAGRLPNYKILVVYDIWYWETERCGYPLSRPGESAASGDQRGQEPSIYAKVTHSSN
jgi:hypothetical protein